MESSKPERLVFKTYLQMLRNAPGTELFRNLYVRGKNGAETDVMKDGAYSCAFFVSAVLTLFGQNSGIHGTIQSTLADLAEHGWQEADSPEPGDVLVWEPWEFDGQQHEHIGFYLGDGQAASTSYKTKTVVSHSADNVREITRIFRQPEWPS